MCSAEQPTIQSQGLLAGDRHVFPVDPHSGSPPREEWGCPQLPSKLSFCKLVTCVGIFDSEG